MMNFLKFLSGGVEEKKKGPPQLSSSSSWPPATQGGYEAQISGHPLPPPTPNNNHNDKNRHSTTRPRGFHTSRKSLYQQHPSSSPSSPSHPLPALDSRLNKPSVKHPIPSHSTPHQLPQPKQPSNLSKNPSSSSSSSIFPSSSSSSCPLGHPLNKPNFSAPPAPPPNAKNNLLQCPRKWTIGQKLGQGTFGTVFEGYNQEDGSFFAVKISNEEQNSLETQQEVAVLSKLSHQNIVRYLGSTIENKNLLIFLELVRMGSLESILKKYNQLDEKIISVYTRQILHGLEYLHSQNTIHRDVKCANILVDVTGQVKLADFGVAKMLDHCLAQSCKGTPVYMAPEVMKSKPGQKSYGFAADIWSLGCTVIEMADGKPPWSDLEGFGFFFKLSGGELPPIPEHLSAEAKDFIANCLQLAPEKRWTASQLLQHPFVANAPAHLHFLPLTHSPSTKSYPPYLGSETRSTQLLSQMVL